MLSRPAHGGYPEAPKPPDHMPEVVGLCPDPSHTEEFYVPHGGPCPAEHYDDTPALIEYRRSE